MSRFHHGHSAALGFILALALERHTLTLLLLALALGIILGRTWAQASRVITAAVEWARNRPTTQRHRGW